MSIFRLFVLQEKTQKTLSTLRYRTFAIGAYFEKAENMLLEVVYQDEDEEDFEAEEHEYYEYLEEIQSL